MLKYTIKFEDIEVGDIFICVESQNSSAVMREYTVTAIIRKTVILNNAFEYDDIHFTKKWHNRAVFVNKKDVPDKELFLYVLTGKLEYEC